MAATTAALVEVAGGAGSTTQTTTSALACSAASAPPSEGPVAKERTVAVDRTKSTASEAVRKAYRAAMLAEIAAAEKARSMLRIVAFGASGVGARVMFMGSFAGASGDEVFDLAATNRTRCQARKAVEATLAIQPGRDGGSDTAGVLASEISVSKETVRPGGSATVTVLSDGCQAPAKRGPNHGLTDLCGRLAKGQSASSILRAHAEEFRLPDASEVSVVMLGVGVGRNAEAASSVFARRLVGFWTVVVCRRAHARSCLVRSSLL